ncbi:MAG TPA: GTP-binding protein [Burkholderiaceae bacterium]|nr:GTP-binding protein [Burkholderiaceae bacterium]
MSALEIPAPIDNGLLRLLTCGSVDDGKSTLIGRVLYDSKSVLVDTLDAIARTSRKRGTQAVDLSLLTDGLQAEREQGITIDVAYRYFSTGTRKYIIADAPGHEQYTRNMVTAASTADLAIILIDARKGMVTQTRRHSYLARLLGIPQVIVAVNKMDLVGFDAEVFERICAEYLGFARTLALTVQFIPMSALHGDMVVERGAHLDWYAGPTLLQALEAAPAAHGRGNAEFRFPVQYIAAVPGGDRRGCMGRVESGEIAVGDVVHVLPAGVTTRVKAIELLGRSLQRAVSEQSVTLYFVDDVASSRGDMLVGLTQIPAAATQLRAMVCWLGAAPLAPERRCVLRHTTRSTDARVSRIEYRVDVNTLRRRAAPTLAMNDIAEVTLELAGPVCADPYASNRATGAFILIDEASNNTVAAGMVL